MAAALVALTVWPLSRAGTALVVRHPAEPPDAIVALASHEWERLPAAAALARQYPASTVLLTVPVEITDTNCHRCAERPQWLIELGVEGGRIRTLPPEGSGTHAEAVAARRYAQERGVRRLAVVTSPYHTRRAGATFATVFGDLSVDVGVYPAERQSPARPEAWWRHGYDRAYVAYEWAAVVYYRLRYGVPVTASTRSDRRPPSTLTVGTPVPA